MKNGLIVVALGSLLVAGCANQSATTQRTVSGAGIGAATGAGIGLLAGAPLTGLAWGAGIGAAGGFLWDQYKKSEGEN